MEIHLELNNLDKAPVRKRFLEKIIKSAIENSRLTFLRDKNIEISLVTLNARDIRKWNRIYRKKNEITDILSFSDYKSSALLKNEKKNTIFLGELILCYNKIKSNSIKFDTTVKSEITNVVAHGILHLLGFRHGRIMFDRQKASVKQINEQIGAI